PPVAPAPPAAWVVVVVVVVLALLVPLRRTSIMNLAKSSPTALARASYWVAIKVLVRLATVNGQIARPAAVEGSVGTDHFIAILDSVAVGVVAKQQKR